MASQNKLANYIPRPESKQAKRHLVGVSTADYEAISKLARENDTTKGRIITALIANFNDD